MEYQFTEIITDNRTIIHSLRSLIDSRTVCKMEIPRTQYSWITLLLDVRKVEGAVCLLIDKVPGFDAILSRFPNREVQLEFKEKGGVPCRFSANIIAFHARDIVCELPRAIYRIQRRKYFRIQGSLGTEMTFRIGPSEEKEKAGVKDFSAGGIAFLTEKDLNFSVGDSLNDVTLNLPEETGQVVFRIPQAAVRRIEPPSLHDGKFLCAAEFIEISKETRDNLIAHIFKNERVEIQRIRR
jgi:c-di-GMP-binding flagellar brake protein YcgR